MQKYVEQLDDILKNFINETNKYEDWFGENPRRREDSGSEKLMPESLLNYRFRGTTFPYEDLLMALDNIVTDKVTSHSASKVKKIETKAPMDIGMAAGTGPPFRWTAPLPDRRRTSFFSFPYPTANFALVELWPRFKAIVTPKMRVWASLGSLCETPAIPREDTSKRGKKE